MEKNVLNRRGREQKFLLQPDPFPCLMVVIGVEHIGERGVLRRLIEHAGVIALQLKVAGRFFRRPQAECQRIKIAACSL